MVLVVLIVCFVFAILGILVFLQKTKKELHMFFRAQSLEVMEKTQKNFLDLARELFESQKRGSSEQNEVQKKSIEAITKPVQETLEKLEKQQHELEKKRESAFTVMEKQLQNLIASEKELCKETFNLTRALRSPSVRGSWGQLHLRRVVELAGMQKYCDFSEQVNKEHEGKQFRPDLVVHLPGSRQIIVDAKTPLYAYLDAVESETEEEKKLKLKEHAAHIKGHIKELSSKEYWKKFQPTPECVVLFLPSEAFFSEAVRLDPHLIEMGFLHNVIVATPTTLISILKAASLSWKQDALSQNAEEIADLGRQLYERLGIMSNHFEKLGKSLGASVESYNQAISSFETRVLVSARKLQEKAGHTKEPPKIHQIEKNVRTLL